MSLHQDIELIEQIVRSEFDVVEKVDKLTEKEPDQFGYGAIHFIVRLGERSSGARYDDLRGLLCEVQVRTVLQDAWAIIGHHLVYKNESAVPKGLQRKLNSLAGLFETADDQFQQVRDQRLMYVETVRESTKEPKEFLQTELNLDSFREYLQWRFPDRPIEAHKGQLGTNLNALRKAGYHRLFDLDNKLNEELLNRASDAMSEMSGASRAQGQFPTSAILIAALAIDNPKLIEIMDILPEEREILGKYRQMPGGKAQRPQK